MLHKVIQDERRHFAFYRAQAKVRLTGNPTAGRIVRRALEKLWLPVGAGVKSDEEVDALALYLFGDSPEGRAAIGGIDETISSLPGLDGLTLVEDALALALDRARRKPGWGGPSSVARRTMLAA